MTKNKVLKIIVAIFVAVAVFVMLTQNTFGMVGDISNKFANTGDKSNATNTVSEIIGKVINIIQIVGAGIAILMLVVLGIQWMSAAPSGKAQIAKSAKYYVLGVIFIFSAVALLQIIKTFAGKNI